MIGKRLHSLSYLMENTSYSVIVQRIQEKARETITKNISKENTSDKNN